MKTLLAGTKVAIASSYGASKAMSVLTNATSAVATLAASHGIIVGDLMEILSGWGRLNTRIARASAVSTNDVTIEGINTLDTAIYPAGTGIGSIREILTWTPVTQLKRNLSSSGGDQKFVDSSELEDIDDTQIPTTRGAIALSLPYYDDASLAWVPIVEAAQDAGNPVGLRMIFRNGSVLYANAYWSKTSVPTFGDEIVAGKIDLSFSKLPVRYAS